MTYLSGIVGGIGGSVGLFLGFSFWMCASSTVKVSLTFLVIMHAFTDSMQAAEHRFSRKKKTVNVGVHIVPFWR